MPVGVYLKQAAQDLKNAIAEQRRAIDDKKRQIAQKEQEMRKRKDELNMDKIRKQSAAGDNDRPTDQRVILAKEAQDDMAEISTIEYQFMKEKDQLLREISDIEKDIFNLNEQAKNFEQRVTE